MSDDAAQAQREADAPAVGTVRKAEDAPGGDAERAAPRAKVSAEDLARALGGAAATSAVKTDTFPASVGPDFGVEEVRDPDLRLCSRFSKRASSVFFTRHSCHSTRRSSCRSPFFFRAREPSLATRAARVHLRRPLSNTAHFTTDQLTTIHHQGDRVEVRWVISDGEDGAATETVVWWGATARRADETNEIPSRDESRTPPSPSRQKKGSAWELHYDSKPEMGFETEIRPVVFTSDGVLEDPGEGTSLRWRREGAEDPVGDDSFDAGDDPVDPNVVHVAAPPADEKGNVSISALLNAQREVDARANGGRSLEQQGAEAFQTLPMDSQQKMASAFAGLRDGLSRAFAELQERNGPDYAITKDDIAEIMRTMHAR